MTDKQDLILFFDTETTGVPRNYRAPITDTDNWPRLVQLGWLLTDVSGKELDFDCNIVRPVGFEIPIGASNVHGITTEMALFDGVDLKTCLEIFWQHSEFASIIVGHNVSFDLNIVGSERVRLGLAGEIPQPHICTMKASTDLCKLPGKYGYKSPRLTELHARLFGCGFDGAHDAMNDVRATARCYFELVKLGVIQ